MGEAPTWFILGMAVIPVVFLIVLRCVVNSCKKRDD